LNVSDRNRWLPALLLGCAAASLFHYVHNAEFLDAYPRMPAWLTPAGVYGAWLGGTAVGVCGYFMLRAGHARSGLILLAIYGVIGLDGLGHYTLAPMSAHSAAMNLSILLEAAMAVALLLAVAGLMVGRWRSA
jgi:hypothetical protein